MSRQVYGVCQHSLVTFHDILVKEMEKLEIDLAEIAIVENHVTSLPRSKILVFTDFASLFSHREALPARKALVFVIDTLPQLYGIEEITFLDCAEPNEGVGYLFRPEKINLRLVRAALKRVAGDKLSKVDMTPAKFEIIPPLIKVIREGMILDKLNNLVYRTSAPTRRDEIRRVLIEHLSGQTTLEEMLAIFKGMFRRGLALTYIEELTAFLKTDKGKAYCAALTQVFKHTAKTPLKLEKVAETHGIDRFELRYLSKLMKALPKRVAVEIGVLHDLKSVVQPRRANKDGLRG